VAEDAAVEDIVEMRSGVSRVFEELVEQRRTTAGVYVSPESSLQCDAVLACVRVKAESLASLPLNIYRKLPGGGKEIAEDLPLQEVLAHQPNGWMTSFEFRELLHSWVLLWGNAYALIKSGRRGAVDELIPLHPSRMEVKRLENGRLRYSYKEVDRPVATEYSQDEIFHIRWLSQDGVTGYVPTTLSRDAIALARAMELHSSAYFGNFGRAGSVIETDQPHKPEALQRFRQQWEDMHRGPDKAYKTAVLPHGMHLKEFKSSNSEDELLAMRRFSVESVARAMRVPVYMIGDLTKSSYSSVEQQGRDFVTFSLMPDLRRWESAVRRDLIVDDKQYFASFDVTALMAGDYQARSEWARTMFNLGVLSVNEIRASEGMNPIEGGERRFVQVNMQLLDAFTSETPTGQPAPQQPAGPQEPQPEAERSAASIIFRQALRKLAAIEADGIEERRNKPAKLESITDRMRVELRDAAEPIGIDIDAFAEDWLKTSNDLLLECHRSGTPYEEVLASWTNRANLSDD
jgi:HK97 family phage portal protein